MGVHQPTWQQVECKLLITNNNRVTSVGAAVEASNKIIAVCVWLVGECVNRLVAAVFVCGEVLLLRQHIGKLAFAFIAPLCTKHCTHPCIHA